MSAPDTNIEKQQHRHKPALGGMAVSAIVAAVLLAGYLIYLAAAGQTPGDAEAPAAAVTATDG